MVRFESAAKGLDPEPLAQFEPLKKSIPKDDFVLAADRLISMEVKHRKMAQKSRKSRTASSENAK